MEIKIRKVKDLSVDPNLARCAVGSKFSQGKYLFADICIYHVGIPATKTFIHSEILKEGLLSNPELMKSIGLKIIDLDAELKEGLEEPDVMPTKTTSQPSVEVEDVEDLKVEEETVSELAEEVTYSFEEASELPYTELLAYAKAQGMEPKGNPKKVDILQFLDTKE